MFIVTEYAALKDCFENVNINVYIPLDGIREIDYFKSYKSRLAYFVYETLSFVNSIMRLKYRKNCHY